MSEPRVPNKPPTEEQPENGLVLGAVGAVPLSAALRWEDEGRQIISSTEFAIYGEGETIDEAVSDFIGHALDYCELLLKLAAAGDATDEEERIASILAPRVVEAYRKWVEREQDEPGRLGFPLSLLWPRQTRQRRPNVWHPSHQSSSKMLSRA